VELKKRAEKQISSHFLLKSERSWERQRHWKWKCRYV